MPKPTPSWTQIAADFVTAYAQGKRPKRGLYDWAGLAANVAMAVFAGCSIWLVFIQMNRDAALHRAWVSVTPEFPSAMRQLPGEFQIDVIYHLENSGGSPARGVSILAMLIPKKASDIVEAQRRLCSSIQKDPNYRGIYPRTIFPGQKFELKRQEAIDAKIADATMRATAPVNDLNFWLIGCVDYRLADGDGRHQTKFAYALAHVGGKSEPFTVTVFIDKAGVAFPIPYMFGGFEAD